MDTGWYRKSFKGQTIEKDMELNEKGVEQI